MRGVGLSASSRRGVDARLAECNVSFNHRRGTLRGMHYQAAPHGQVKLVRCTTGAIYDVIVDLRPESPTFKGWVGMELTADNRRMLYIPAEFAHGFQTLADNTEVFYQVPATYAPERARCALGRSGLPHRVAANGRWRADHQRQRPRVHGFHTVKRVLIAGAVGSSGHAARPCGGAK